MVRLDPEEFVNIRKIEFLVEQRSHAFAKQLRLVDAEAKVRDGSRKATLFGYMIEDGAPPNCSRFDEDSPAVGLSRPVPPMRDPSYQSEVYDDDWVEPPVVVQAAKRAPFLMARASSPISRTVSAPIDTSRNVSTSSATLGAARPAPQAASSGPSRSLSAAAVFPSKRPAPRLSSHVPVSTPLLDPDELSLASATLPDFGISDAITFPAGSYDVILILDTREVESKTNRDKIAETLEAKGVKVETRALRLGDMCWIARRVDGLGGEEDEAVLDYVVERKRLDDLCSSIKDGRYTEQCVSPHQ